MGVLHEMDMATARLGRAIADHALSRYLRYPITACLATAIEADKENLLSAA
jgi:hypothetical protein